MTSSNLIKPDKLNVVVALALIIKLLVNYLSNALPINGFTPGQLSDLYTNQFVPAGFTFSIWGIIYASCILLVYNFFRNPNRDDGKIKWIFILVCILNIAWLFAWHYQIMGLSVLIMIAFFGILLWWYLLVRKKENSPIILQITSSLYLGWISVALVANITAWLVYHDVLIGNDAKESIITSMVIGIVALIAIFMSTKFKDFAYPLVVAWAAYGIYSKRIAVDNIDDHYATMASLALVVIALVLVIINAYKFVKK